VEVVPPRLGRGGFGKGTAGVCVVREPGGAGRPLKGLGTFDGFLSLDAIGKTLDAFDRRGTQGELE